MTSTTTVWYGDSEGAIILSLFFLILVLSVIIGVLEEPHGNICFHTLRKWGQAVVACGGGGLVLMVVGGRIGGYCTDL